MSFLVMKLDQCVYLLFKAMINFFDVMESKPILKGTRLQSICRFVENHFAVQSICDRVLNFDLQPHYQKQTHSAMRWTKSQPYRVSIVSVPLVRVYTM